MHKAITHLQNSHSTYIKCQRDWEQVHEENQRTAFDPQVQGKHDRKKTIEDEAVQKVRISNFRFKSMLFINV